MATKMKGFFKGFKYFSQIFGKAYKEHEMEIGYPTDVRHVTHIGWNSSPANAPSWMNEFKTASDFSMASLGGDGPTTELSWASSQVAGLGLCKHSWALVIPSFPHPLTREFFAPPPGPSRRAPGCGRRHPRERPCRIERSRRDGHDGGAATIHPCEDFEPPGGLHHRSASLRGAKKGKRKKPKRHSPSSSPTSRGSFAASHGGAGDLSGRRLVI